MNLQYAVSDQVEQKTRNGRFGYQLTDIKPYTTIHGVPSAILTWRGTCAVCGAPFTVTTGRQPPRWLRRTCPKHRGHYKAWKRTNHHIRARVERDLPNNKIPPH
jgi:hypothetical protein